MYKINPPATKQEITSKPINIFMNSIVLRFKPLEGTGDPLIKPKITYASLQHIPDTSKSYSTNGTKQHTNGK
jgi:hypothetical protein